jgi:hypothetical protein
LAGAEPLPVLGVLGAAGEVVDELEPPPIEPLELPPEVLPLVPDEPVPPLELEEPDLLKWASHSAREIWPSPLVSTDEKLGVEALLELELGELELVPPAAPVDDEPLDELPLAADGADAPDLELLASSAALASVARAKSAAAVVTVTVLSIRRLLSREWETGSPRLRASAMPVKLAA